MSDLIVTVERLGAQGDGVAMHEGKPLHIPFTAVGDVARIRIEKTGRARLVDLVERSPARRTPPCPHFGLCGGCALQHLDDDSYRRAKEDTVRRALAQRGLDPAIVGPLRQVPAGSRRRARLALAWTRDGAVEIGFRQRASHRIVDMQTCLVLHPKLFALAGALREAAPSLLARGAEQSVTMNLADSGLDVVLERPQPPDLAALEAMAAFAEAQDLARLSWRREGEAAIPVVQRCPVRISFDGVAVDLPPDAFLQASAEGEAVLRELVVAGVDGATVVADLFSGLGTFTFALAKTARVHAVEGEKNAVAALLAAVRRAELETCVTAERRDLERNPLRAEELDRFDAVVFDPPYAGAKAQAGRIAQSRVKRVVGVSCNPASFARDAGILVDGGFRLIRVTPVDLFVWSAEVELVAAFER